MGFEGRVLEYFTNKKIEGCTVKFWGGSFKDTMIGYTDTGGYFKLFKYYKPATGTFSLRVTHKVYGTIVSKTITLYNGCLDGHLYFVYATSWLKLNFITLSKWKNNDNFEFKWDNGSFKKYGIGLNQFDTSFIIKTKYDGMPKKFTQFYNKDSLYQRRILLYDELWDTSENIIIF